MTLNEKLDPGQNVRVRGGTEYLVCNDRVSITCRSQEEIEKEYRALKEASDRLDGWIPA